MAESNSILIFSSRSFEILKITTNDDLLRVYCHSNFQANLKMDTY